MQARKERSEPIISCRAASSQVIVPGSEIILDRVNASASDFKASKFPSRSSEHILEIRGQTHNSDVKICPVLKEVETLCFTLGFVVEFVPVLFLVRIGFRLVLANRGSVKEID